MRISKSDKAKMLETLTNEGMEKETAEKMIVDFENGSFADAFQALNNACKANGPSIEDMANTMEDLQNKLDEMAAKLDKVQKTCTKEKQNVKEFLSSTKDAVLQTAGNFSLSVWNKLEMSVSKAKTKLLEGKDALKFGLVHLKNKILVTCKTMETTSKIKGEYGKSETAEVIEKYQNMYASALMKAEKKVDKAIDTLAFGTKAAVRALEQSKGDLTSLVEKRNALENEMQDSVRDIQEIGANLSQSELVQTASRVADIGLELDAIKLEIADKVKEVNKNAEKATSKASKLAEIKQAISGLFKKGADIAYDNAAKMHDIANESILKANDAVEEYKDYVANHPTGFVQENDAVELD